MKLSILALVTLFSATAFAHNYQCISNRLQAYNSDIYMDMTKEEIDELLASQNDGRAPMVRRIAKICDSKN